MLVKIASRLFLLCWRCVRERKLSVRQNGNGRLIKAGGGAGSPAMGLAQ